tara:strand:- start:166 stop:453 length:288 start_codon:yes stop_codon:yes gene_type:complete
MPFALIPDGFKLQKVTKLQKEAVDKYNSSKNIEAFFEGPASAELVKAVAIVVTPIILAALAKQGANIGKESLDKIIDKTLESFDIDLSALGQFNL